MDQGFALQQADVVAYFKKWIEDNPNRSICIGVIVSLNHIIQNIPLSSTSELFKSILPSLTFSLHTAFPGIMSVKSACDIYQRVISRSDFNTKKPWTELVRSKSQILSTSALNSISTIHSCVNSFISNGQVILVHSYSKITSSALIHAANCGKHFSVILTESRPDCESYILAAQLKQYNIPVTLITDASIAHVMNFVDLAVVGAEAVVENGGIINKIGSYQLAIIAKTLSKPLYVITESYKFQRSFLFNQRDIQDNVITGPTHRHDNISGVTLHRTGNNIDVTNNEDDSTQQGDVVISKLQSEDRYGIVIPTAIGSANISSDEYLNFKWDYTPPEYISLLFTDLGVLSPPAVSDELIKLHY